MTLLVVFRMFEFVPSLLCRPKEPFLRHVSGIEAEKPVYAKVICKNHVGWGQWSAASDSVTLHYDKTSELEKPPVPEAPVLTSEGTRLKISWTIPTTSPSISDTIVAVRVKGAPSWQVGARREKRGTWRSPPCFFFGWGAFSRLHLPVPGQHLTGWLIIQRMVIACRIQQMVKDSEHVEGFSKVPVLTKEGTEG